MFWQEAIYPVQQKHHLFFESNVSQIELFSLIPH